MWITRLKSLVKLNHINFGQSFNNINSLYNYSYLSQIFKKSKIYGINNNSFLLYRKYSEIIRIKKPTKDTKIDYLEATISHYFTSAQLVSNPLDGISKEQYLLTRESSFQKETISFQNKKRTNELIITDYIRLIKAAGTTGRYEVAKHTFEEMIKLEFDNKYAYISFMQACARNCKVEDVLKLFEILKTKESSLDAYCYHPVILVYGVTQQYDKALKLFDTMKEQNIKITLAVYHTVLEICHAVNDLVKGWELYKEMREADIDIKPATHAVIIHLLVKNKKHLAAYEIGAPLANARLHKDKHLHAALATIRKQSTKVAGTSVMK